jgi:Transposase DDE domain
MDTSHGAQDNGRKRRLIVDTLGLLLVVMVTSATVHDRPGGRTILQRLAARFPRVALVWADGGYANKIDSGLLGWAKEKLGLLVEIVKRKGREPPCLAGRVPRVPLLRVAKGQQRSLTSLSAGYPQANISAAQTP